MDMGPHTLTELFDQLGLPSDPQSIDAFIAQHRPLPEGKTLTQAPFWTDSQARLLKEKLADDADWAPVVDSLNVRLAG